MALMKKLKTRPAAKPKMYGPNKDMTLTQWLDRPMILDYEDTELDLPGGKRRAAVLKARMSWRGWDVDHMATKVRVFAEFDVWTLDCLRALPPSEKMDFIKDLDVYNITKGLDMKFDCVIMNPPYQKNLHLKVLAEAIKHLKDDGVCVNLSPVRWLQDPLAKYKKSCDLKRFEESVAKHIESLEVIDQTDSNKLFNIDFNAQLAIYKCSSVILNKDLSTPKQKIVQSIARKIFSKIVVPKIVQYKNSAKKTFVPICLMCGHVDINEKGGNKFSIARYRYKYFVDGKCMCERFLNQTPEQCKSYNIPSFDNVLVIECEDEKEAKALFNWISSPIFEAIMKLFMTDSHIHPQFLPWLGDAVNPRTGLKGYLGEWTDEDFYRYFELTDDEIKTVEDTMKKYAAK